MSLILGKFECILFCREFFERCWLGLLFLYKFYWGVFLEGFDWIFVVFYCVEKILEMLGVLECYWSWWVLCKGWCYCWWSCLCDWVLDSCMCFCWFVLVLDFSDYGGFL